jgi:putative ABC transport system permease protein
MRWTASVVNGASHDVRLAWRTMCGAKGLAATIVLTLALGIGANAAIFGIINSLILRSLPVPDPQRFVTVAAFWNYDMWSALEPHAAAFEGTFAWTPARFDLADGGEREPVDGVFASGGYFATLGVAAMRGRTFTDTDDRRGRAAGPVAVISYRLWQQRFGGAEHVIGAPLRVDGATVTVVGVTGPEFLGLDIGRPFDVALPLDVEPLIHGERSTLRTSRLLVSLRLKPGQSIESATATIRALQPQIMGTAEGSRSQADRRPAPFTLMSTATGISLPVRGPHGLRDTYTRPLVIIQAVALLVLLIACVNIAHLLLARAAARRYELGVRLALGASRGRLARQALIENLLLAIVGAIAGMFVGHWGSHALISHLSAPGVPITLDLAPDWRVVAFTGAVTLGVTVIFGAVPAVHAARMGPLDVLRAHGRAGPSRSTGVVMSSGLVVQIAISLTLIISTGLLVRSFVRIWGVPLGFDPNRVLVANVDTKRSPLDGSDRLQLFQRIVDGAARVPGVQHAGGAIWAPVDGGMRMGDSQSRITFNFVTPGWFAAFGTALRAGRDFTRLDTAAAPPVVIVNEAFVRAFIPGGSPLGETTPHPRSGDTEVRRTIVGVVEDMVFDTQREGIQPMVYMPVAQSRGLAPHGVSEISIGVRPAAGSPMRLAPSVGAALEVVDPNLTFSFHPLTADVQASVRQERLVASISAAFGTLALAIAALGLYGVTSYSVSRRVMEIGIRRALGAQHANVIGLVLGRSLMLTAAGIVLGMGCAAAVTGALRGMLFGLTPLDPATFAGAAGLFAAVTTIAAAIPAVRAARIDPVVALRAE